MSVIESAAVVVGTGVSGLCAALALGRRGCKVMILEKQSEFGGNGKWALTGINLCNTSAQESRGITDSAVMFKKDMLRAGNNQNDPALVDVLVNGVKTARDLLAELDITLSDVVNSGGHSVSRTHKPPNWPVDSKPMGQLFVSQVNRIKSCNHFRSEFNSVPVIVRTREVRKCRDGFGGRSCAPSNRRCCGQWRQGDLWSSVHEQEDWRRVRCQRQDSGTHSSAPPSSFRHVLIIVFIPL